MKSKALVMPLAVLGVLLSHELTYRVFSAVSGNNFEGLLQVTGHAWYSHIVPIVVALIAISLFSIFTSRKNASFISVLSAQVIGFISLEVSERVIFGGSYSDFAYIILLGLFFQIPAASIVVFTSRTVFYFKESFAKQIIPNVFVVKTKHETLYNEGPLTTLYNLVPPSRGPPFLVSFV